MNIGKGIDAFSCYFSHDKEKIRFYEQKKKKKKKKNIKTKRVLNLISFVVFHDKYRYS